VTAGDEHRLSVAFTPVYANPYQALLSDALGNLGVEVVPQRRLPELSWLRSERPRIAVLHLHWLYGLYMSRFLTPFQTARFLRWLRAAGRLGYHLVWTAHNILPHRRPLPPLHRFIRRVVVSRADAIITHCRSARDELLHSFPTETPVHVIPHGSYIGVYPFDTSREAARRELGVDGEAFVYLSLGNIARYKGFDTLVDEFSRRPGPDERLVIAGRDRDRPLVRSLQAAAARDDRITIHPGFIPDDRMQLYLAAADVLVCPFREILGSGSLILGMSYGLPVIAPAVGCLHELVTPEAGSLYDPRRRGALGRAMDEARGWNLAAMSAASRAICDDLRWDRIAGQTLEVYRSCRGSSSPG
jgi:glycosyltransferase involved in cell wall biosynthesis